MSLTQAAGLELLQHTDILALGKMADEMRQKLHPGKTVTFVIDRNINYSNVCVSECKFCAFFRPKDHKDAYILSTETMLEKIKETIAAGGTQVMIQGGLHPELDLKFYLDLLYTIKQNYDITIHSFSPAEIVHMAKQANLSVIDTLKELKAAGLDSLPGGGAEILVDEVRQRVSPKKISAGEWLNVMECAHSIGMQSTATMVIGMGETLAQRIAHMEKVRALQEKTGGFRAFITWTFQPGNTVLGGEKISAWEYLKTLATTRLYLDNIKHIQGSWVTQGQNIGQLTLAFGANDLGSIMLEENVVKAAGTSYQMSIDKMVGMIEATGRVAAQRDTAYHIIKKF
ncbi:cyclic dehypoxanthinyl futalosine synthase [Anaerosinus massiliensis]|uniref:cyclic dehypoxanthinyl futalosine synthase n=1 Tax=Massilibacillus massiliensis TaxID=1806837 RepID=UPI000A938CD4|nr:cyclic dehypoxanthinyl futalosine synthase [Massilibacillus massiliensis]